MPLDALTSWMMSCMLLSLRIAPVFALAPPFSLVRMPALFRVLLGIGLAATIASFDPAAAVTFEFSTGSFLVAAIRELFLGAIFVLAFQLTFGALYMAGRTVDIQAGYGLALLIDPTSRSQTPLVGTLFAYAAGAIFFAMNGHHDLIRILAASLDAIPLGSPHFPTSPDRVIGFMSIVFLTSLGVAGGAILSLFLVDMAIAVLARTAPQMNALVLGFQVKTIVLLLVLPATFGFAGALLARLMSFTLESIPELLQ